MPPNGLVMIGKKVRFSFAVAQPHKQQSEAEKMKQKYPEEKAVQFGLQPIALGFFGEVYNYNKEPWWAKKALEADRPRVEATYKQSEPRIYDTRDRNAIRSWAQELAQKALA